MAVGHPLLSWPVLGVAGAGFLLGARHGLDWDHIAAITDLTTAQRADCSPSQGPQRRSEGIRLPLWYCIGHGLVIALLGVAVALLGVHLPATLDRVFESVVGTTLVVLGTFVLWQLGREGARYRYSGRIRLLVGIIRQAWARARRRGSGPAEPFDDLSSRSAFAVGVLHGTGAETPTQVVLFASAAASGAKLSAALILFAFVTGLIVSDLGIATVWLCGLGGTRRAPKAQMALGFITGISSMAIGALILIGRSAVLPALFGG